MTDYSTLKNASPEILHKFKSELENNGFHSEMFQRLSGKEITRHVRISAHETHFLRSQILYNRPGLLNLTDLFLLKRPVYEKVIKKFISPDVLDHLISIDILKREHDRIACSCCITPVNGNYFLNDGDEPNPPKDHVFPISQEQPYLISTFGMFRSDLPGQKKILDICSGSGVIGQCIQGNNDKTIGVDINPRAVEFSTFNALLNNLDTHYRVSDFREFNPSEKYDIIVSNPPYNGHVRLKNGNGNNKKDITVHSGSFGDQLTNAIFHRLDDFLNDNDLCLIVAAWLLKDGKLANKKAAKLADKGTLILLHQPIVPAMSWEGLRRLFALQPDYELIPEGYMKKMISKSGYFNQVTWGVLIYKKGGKPGFHKEYNISADAHLINQNVKNHLLALAS